MSGIVQTLGAPSTYRDRRYEGGLEKLEADLAVSSTLYVGNLSFFSTEEQIHEVFSKCGEVKRIIMGLDRIKKTPCGFCFVEYYSRNDALDAMKYINSTKVDERIIRTDIDPGFVNGRQFGRGKSGGQVRDEWREDYDEGRGGWGARIQEEEAREQQQKDVYGTLGYIPQGASNYSQTTVPFGKRDREDDSFGYRSKSSRFREGSPDNDL